MIGLTCDGSAPPSNLVQIWGEARPGRAAGRSGLRSNLGRSSGPSVKLSLRQMAHKIHGRTRGPPLSPPGFISSQVIRLTGHART